MQNINKSLRYHLVAMTERLSPGLAPAVNQTLDKDTDNKRGSTAAPEARLRREREPATAGSPLRHLLDPCRGAQAQRSTVALLRCRDKDLAREAERPAGLHGAEHQEEEAPEGSPRGSDCQHPGVRRAGGRNWGATPAPTARGASPGPVNTAPSGDPWG